MSQERNRLDGDMEKGVQAPGIAFLLSQLGSHAAGLFEQRVAQLDLNPPQAGLLRLVALQPGRSQQALANQLGVAPSKIVALVDELETRGLLERRRSTTDRRHYAVNLTPAGAQVLSEIRDAALQHEDALTAALNGPERQKLTELLQRIADHQHLERGVHPGYRDLPVRSPQRRTRPV